jgi:hypothetical protein
MIYATGNTMKYANATVKVLTVTPMTHKRDDENENKNVR